jgi:hypothetical protein
MLLVLFFQSKGIWFTVAPPIFSFLTVFAAMM